MIDDRLWTTRAVASYVGVSPETILRRYRSGELRGVRISTNAIRFRQSDVELWLRSGTKAGTVRGVE